MKPLLYLEIRQFINSIKNAFRSPRRLIPALLVAAGIFSWVLQSAFLISGTGHLGRHGMPGLNAAAMPTEMIRAVAFLMLSFGSLVILFQAFSTGSLVFSIAHIDFLFPTPISRRAVLLVKLVKDYLKYAFWVTFMVIFTGVPLLMSINVRLFPAGLWSIAALTAYILFVINVTHAVNIIFTFGFERLKQTGKLVKLIMGVTFGSAVVIGVRQYLMSGDCCFSVLWAVNSPVIKTIFAPADWCASLVLAPLEGVTSADTIHLGLLCGLAAASFAFLMSRKENIYEPSLGVSVRATRVRQAMRSGDATALRVQMMQEKGKKSAGMMVIPPFGKGAVALLWKSLAIRYRMSWTQLLMVLVLPGVVTFVIQRSVNVQEILCNLPFVLVYLTYIMSITIQPQVRAELKHANVLKSMPIAAWKVMLAQVVNGSLYLTLGISVFAASMWLFVPATRNDLLKVCAIGSPFLGFACVSATVIPALMYPDTRDSAQNFFCSLIGFMLISFVMIPTVVLGVVLFGLANVSYYGALIPMCIVNLLLGAVGVSVSGAIFRRFDPTNE